MTSTTVPWGNAVRLTLAGGLAFWVANLAISLTPIAAEYRAALSIPYWPMTVAALVGGLLVAGCVSGLLLALGDRIPGKSLILKATVLGLLVMGVIEAFSIAIDADHLTVFHVVGVIINVPRFLALGWMIGWLAGQGARPDPKPAGRTADATR